MGASCSYDYKSEGDRKALLRYTHHQKEWVRKEIPPINTDFSINKRMSCIVSSSLHGLGLFSMDGIKVSYNKFDLMEYVGPCYNYNNWMRIVKYKKRCVGMH